MKSSFGFLILISIVLTMAGCCVVPSAPHAAVVPHCEPQRFCPAVTSFGPAYDRYPYLDHNSGWRLLSRDEFRDRFGLTTVGQPD